ncbi:MAG: Peptide chain release factor 2 [Chlamydiia bacterium]|nr:Peptide chain release factor 2 [Chlamydiia bacterium]
MESPTFWDDQESAQRVISEANGIRDWVVPIDKLDGQLDGIIELYPEVLSEDDGALKQEMLDEVAQIEKALEKLEIDRMLSGEFDAKNCYLSINAGAGGTESCDWALMLSRMYERWVAKKGWKVEVENLVPGDVAGIKSITYRIEGKYAYGYCSAEKGVHRLVRISPFDSNAKRHTSFASVDIVPIIEDDIVVDIAPEDLRVDTFRATGAGGQHVNTTDSAVRVTHNPTGIVVSSQKERSQANNRERCMKMLKSKLYELKVEEKAESIKELSGAKREIAWGSQIRSYTLQPYCLVKDTRTKHEEGNAEAVLNGEIDPFVIAYLKGKKS